MKHWKFIAPLLIFIALLGFLGVGLNLNPSEVPSPLIGKPAPAFVLPRLDDPAQKLGLQDMRGKVWMLNVWASWCAACRQEQAALVAFSRRGLVPIYGLNYKDTRPEALAWLERWGNPYAASLSDDAGRVGIDFGVYGVPETFLIDKQGVVRFKQVGPLTPELLRDRIEPLLKELNA